MQLKQALKNNPSCHMQRCSSFWKDFISIVDNAIKATFMQAPPSLEVPPSPTSNGGVNLLVTAPINVTKEASSRSSSASRGRGIVKKTND